MTYYQNRGIINTHIGNDYGIIQHIEGQVIIMTRIRIVSNPYERALAYFINNGKSDSWETLKQDSINSKLRENDSEKIFLPFKANDIVDTIVSEYYTGPEKVGLEFEGTPDEYKVLEEVCAFASVKDKIELSCTERSLENARDVLDDTKNVFERVRPIIEKIVREDQSVTNDLAKVTDALKDIIPICIFGNYSAGKSTFINSLIGYEILPSGGDPVTAKIYEIRRSRQEDRAKITFTYLGEDFELQFDDNECRVIVGDKDKDMIQEIQSSLAEIDEKCLFKMVNKTISILNSYEKRDKEVIVLSNVIKIETPFSKNGKLGQSQNKFVIFDTPGSNSKTNMDHQAVLIESLQGFSNGIPVWVSSFDSLDSVDNANLCDKLYSIDALDKRFTMIVINRADNVELPKNGFSDREINDILEYDSVEKMYSSGIYFVSAVMGLGAKNIDGMQSEYLLDLFDEKERKYSDPDARGYKKLYEYNIMPEHMKRKAIKNSLECDKLVYANSGLYCVESEMEQFANKYAAYNKCQMVYRFLNSVIDETQKRIAEKTSRLEIRKVELEQELDGKKKELIESIQKETQSSIKINEKQSEDDVRVFVKENLQYELKQEALDKIDNSFAQQHEESTDYQSFEEDYEKSKDNRLTNAKENLHNFIFGKGSRKDALKNLKSEWTNDSEVVKQRKENKDSTRKQIDSTTSEQTMNIVKDMFKADIIEAQGKLQGNAQVYWLNKSQEYRDSMIRLITGTDALSEKQKNELSEIIMNYPPFKYDDDSDDVFIKAKFLRQSFLASLFGLSERINTKRLSASFNSKIKRSIREMSEQINSSYFESFKEWQGRLQSTIEANITNLNPELRDLYERIRDEEDRITELKSNQRTISESIDTIRQLMEWKQPE